MTLQGSHELIDRLRRQQILTVPYPRRTEVTALEVDEQVQRAGTVAVWRNHAIEPLQPLLHPYLQSAGLALHLALGGYDDALSLAPYDRADLELIWYDLDRLALGDDEALDWFIGRVSRCAESAAGPVVVVPISDRPAHTAAVADHLLGLPGVRCADPWPLCEEAAVALIDERTYTLTGTRVSRDAQIHIARALGAQWLPASLLPPRKMVAVDLDETLHGGVLGEDGIRGVAVTPGHARLHAFLKRLSAEGVLLALVSRNELKDVEGLFAERCADYGLSLDDFATVEVSWGSKVDAVRSAAAAARIGEDAVVFVDDNPGELLTVGLECPSIALVHAGADADRTVDALRWQPGLWRWTADEAATVRVGDLAANSARELLRHQAVDFNQYLEQLGVRAEIAIDPEDQLTRLADLCAKTNQFNLAVARLGEADLQQAMRAGSACVASVALSDRLANSGVIAVLVARSCDGRLCVEELAISCRALGRGLESPLISQALRAMPLWDQARELCFRVRETDRNLPARRWLGDIAGLGPDQAPVADVIIEGARVDEILLPKALAVTIKRPGAGDK